jgi:hypothetical protein
MGYEYRRCTAATREGRVKFLNDALAEGLEYVAGMQEGVDPRPTLADPREVLFRSREEPPRVEGPAVWVVLDGLVVGTVPLRLCEGEHRVSVVAIGRSGVPSDGHHFDVGDGAVEVRAMRAPSSASDLRDVSNAETQGEIDARRRAMAAEVVADRGLKTVLEAEQFARCWVETAAMHAANEDYWRGRAREAEAKLVASLLHEELEHVTSRSSWVRPEPVARDFLDEMASRPHLTWTDEEKREQLRALDACRCAPGTDHLPECPRLRMVVERSLHDFAQGELMVKWNRLHPGEQTRLLQAWTAELSVRDPCKDPPLSFAGFFKVKLVEGR